MTTAYHDPYEHWPNPVVDAGIGLCLIALVMAMRAVSAMLVADLVTGCLAELEGTP
tara:strand:+ start:553 stop:720 length:168 start_codon:yes stop_codon:yes gene_type:complete